MARASHQATPRYAFIIARVNPSKEAVGAFVSDRNHRPPRSARNSRSVTARFGTRSVVPSPSELHWPSLVNRKAAGSSFAPQGQQPTDTPAPQDDNGQSLNFNGGEARRTPQRQSPTRSDRRSEPSCFSSREKCRALRRRGSLWLHQCHRVYRGGAPRQERRSKIKR